LKSDDARLCLLNIIGKLHEVLVEKREEGIIQMSEAFMVSNVPTVSVGVGNSNVQVVDANVQTDHEPEALDESNHTTEKQTMISRRQLVTPIQTEEEDKSPDDSNCIIV